MKYLIFLIMSFSSFAFADPTPDHFSQWHKEQEAAQQRQNAEDAYRREQQQNQAVQEQLNDLYKKERTLKNDQIMQELDQDTQRRRQEW